jgi:protein TonB
MEVAMEFVLQRRNPGRNITGLVLVVALHVGMVMALMVGLTRHIPLFNPPPPIEWVSIKDTPKPVVKPAAHKPPTPLTAPVIAPRDLLPDLPPIVDTVTSSSTTVNGDPGTSTGSGAGESTGAVSSSVGIACPNSQGVRSSMRYPVQARREGLQGDVLARFVVGANGRIRDISIVDSTNRAFNGAVIEAVREFSCVAQGQDVTVEVPFSFRLQ